MREYQFCDWCKRYTDKTVEDQLTTDDESVLCDRCFDAYKQGQQSCAAGPWTYRTDTGDKKGQVVESAELPSDDKCGYYIALLDYGDEDSPYYELMIAVPNRETLKFELHFTDKNPTNETWLRKHLIAWAEIRTGANQ
jgi:hypothetical protein